MEPLVPPFVPVLLAALVLPVLGRRVGHALGLSAIASIVPYVWLVPAGQHLPVSLFGFEAELFAIDPFSALMGYIFGFIGAVAVLYSWASDADSVQTAFALGYVATSLGAVFAGDWLSLLLFWELMAITSTLLVWHYGGRAVRAGFRYALLHGIGGTLLMGAVVWHYAETGSFMFAGTGMAGSIAPVLAAVGIGVNVGFVGLHTWLPDTYPRPHFAASVFLCVYTTKTGVYGMYRAFPDGHLLLAYMGGAMAVFGVTYALFQSDMRRLLSYHIQSQVGYMIAGVGIGTGLATAGAFAHVFNHILYKALLFMTVGVVIYRTGAESLDRIHGLARALPVTFVTFTVAALSIAGFPGFNGFVSKGMILYEAHHYPEYELLWYMLLAAGVGTFMSFIKLGYYVFFYGEQTHEVDRATLGQSIAMGSVAVLCVAYGLFPDALVAILPNSATAADFEVFTIAHVVDEGLVLAAIGVVGFAILKRPLQRVGRVPDIDRIYNPAAFYGTRTVVVAVTELYAAVDGAVRRLAAVSIRVAQSPDESFSSIVGDVQFGARPDIRDGILIIGLVLVAALVLLV